MSQSVDEFNIYDIVNIFKKYWKMIFIPSLTAALLAFVLSNLFLTKKYESYSILKINEQIDTIDSIREIMYSDAILKEICLKVKGKEDVEYTKEIADKMFFNEVAGPGHLKILSKSNSAKEANSIAVAATEIVFKRQNDLYEAMQKRMISSIKSIKEISGNSILSLNAKDLNFAPARVDVAPILNNTPLPSLKKVITITAFFLVFFINSLIAIYLFGKGK